MRLRPEDDRIVGITCRFGGQGRPCEGDEGRRSDPPSAVHTGASILLERCPRAMPAADCHRELYCVTRMAMAIFCNPTCPTVRVGAHIQPICFIANSVG